MGTTHGGARRGPTVPSYVTSVLNLSFLPATKGNHLSRYMTGHMPFKLVMIAFDTLILLVTVITI